MECINECISCGREWIQAIPNEWAENDILDYAKREYEYEKSKNCFNTQKKFLLQWNLLLQKHTRKWKEREKINPAEDTSIFEVSLKKN